MFYLCNNKYVGLVMYLSYFLNILYKVSFSSEKKLMPNTETEWIRTKYEVKVLGWIKNIEELKHYTWYDFKKYH